MTTIHRTTALLLTLTLLFPLFHLAPTKAAESSSFDELEVVRALGILEGDENGNLNLYASVTRGEFVKMMVAASEYKDSIGNATGSSLFKDVKSDYWGSEYIKVAVNHGWVVGYTDGTFRPNNTITLAEATASTLRLLGYDSSTLAGTFPSAHLNKAESIGLLENIDSNPTKRITRNDCVTLFYNLMMVQSSTGTYYLNSLEPTLQLIDAQGEINLVALINDAIEGPILAASNWQAQLPFTSENTTYYRNGTQVSSYVISPNDVLYYSKSMRTVWAFSQKVSGTITNLSPDSSNPNTVTVAGQTYAIGTSSAAYALSNIGTYHEGSVVTLLLGRDGTVAFVVGSATLSSDTIGVVINTDDATFTDSTGHDYTGNAITLLGLDGATYLYPNEGSTNYKNGDVVRVSVSENGTEIDRISGGTISGSVNMTGTNVGNTSFSNDVQILDVYDGKGRIIPTSRLQGSLISNDDVYYVSKNPLGEIDVLILDDFTGDIHDFALITAIDETTIKNSDGSTYKSYTYTYNIDGITKTWTDSVSRNLNREPVELLTQDGSIRAILSLSIFDIETISGNNALDSSGASHTLSDDVTVYLYNHNTQNYYVSSLSHITAGDYQLAGYYDKNADEGGRIRIILAR